MLTIPSKEYVLEPRSFVSISADASAMSLLMTSDSFVIFCWRINSSLGWAMIRPSLSTMYEYELG